MTDKILTMRDAAQVKRAFDEDGNPSVRRALHLQLQWAKKSGIIDPKAEITEEVRGAPVMARIDHGRWIADCECGGAEAVDPDEPIFFCCSCGNDANTGYLRRVTFPPAEQRAEIEAELLKRPVKKGHGPNAWQRNRFARAVDLPRNWQPGESIAGLKQQNQKRGLR